MFLPAINKIPEWYCDILRVKEVTPRRCLKNWIFLNLLFKKQFDNTPHFKVIGVRFYQSQYTVEQCERKYVDKHHCFLATVLLWDKINKTITKTVIWSYSFTENAADVYDHDIMKWTWINGVAVNDRGEKEVFSRSIKLVIDFFQSTPRTQTYLARYCVRVKGFLLVRYYKAWKKCLKAIESSANRVDLVLPQE